MATLRCPKTKIALNQSRNKRGTQQSAAPKVALLHHFMFPDDVVSAQLFHELAEDLASQGWEVEALPCNRGCSDESRKFPRKDRHQGVDYKRIWRPSFSQRSFFGRIANSVWMIGAWSMIAIRPRSERPDVVIIGTDPVFGLAAAIPIRLLSPSVKIAHWCFDLHPEAAFVTDIVGEQSLFGRVAQRTMRIAYSKCDLIVDIGSCMRNRLQRYQHGAKEIELTPWALKEPASVVPCDAKLRQELFGDAKLGLLYSGSFGEAHSYEAILQLARSLRDCGDIHFCFAARGSRSEALRSAVTTEDSNISFADLAPLNDLERRLGAADIHIVSLKKDWAGVAVPSKFFGSLSIGRPVLFSGPADSAIGRWIEEHGLGWVLSEETVSVVDEQLRQLIAPKASFRTLREVCFRTYRDVFSRQATTSSWDTALRALLAAEDTVIETEKNELQHRGRNNLASPDNRRFEPGSEHPEV
ncbi:MAG: glycosyltransferase family 4 protein [Pseudomonadota bacterium]